MPARRGFVLDANVLIDFLSAGPDVLALISQHLGRVLVPTPVLQEVRMLTEEQCRHLGFELYLPSLEQFHEAAQDAIGSPLSFTDRICHVVARDEGCTGVTNDKRLRRLCDETSVEVLWGLELMLDLVQGRHLEPAQAEAVAWKIHEENLFVTRDTVIRFSARLTTWRQR